MKKEEELLRELTELVKDTQAGRLDWEIQCQTSEYNDPDSKPTVKEDGVTWTVDECFVSYHCMHRNSEFLMITYERICSNGSKKKTDNLIFLPPLSIRFFDVGTLAPYAVNANQMLVYDAHMLWLSIMEKYKQDPDSVLLEVTRRQKEEIGSY